MTFIEYLDIALPLLGEGLLNLQGGWCMFDNRPFDRLSQRPGACLWPALAAMVS